MRLKVEDTVSIYVRYRELFEIMATVRENRVRHMPLKRVGIGYILTIENGPVATMLKLKYEK
jgi:hypothetical protein